MSTLTIDDYSYHRILTCVGWPIITEADLKVDSDFIKDYLILPPLKNIFFKWFPIEVPQQISVGTSFEYDFPDDETFGVVDIRLVLVGRGTTRTGNPLINESIIKVKSGGYYNKWGTGNDYGFGNVNEIEKARIQSSISSNKALKKKIDYNNRKIIGYSNMEGDLSITWAKYSTDFNDIPHKFIEDVIKLSQSFILRYFGDLRNQSTSNLPTELDGASFIDRADELYEEVTAKFQNFTKPVLIKT